MFAEGLLYELADKFERDVMTLTGVTAGPGVYIPMDSDRATTFGVYLAPVRPSSPVEVFFRIGIFNEDWVSEFLPNSGSDFYECWMSRGRNSIRSFGTKRSADFPDELEIQREDGWSGFETYYDFSWVRINKHHRIYFKDGIGFKPVSSSFNEDDYLALRHCLPHFDRGLIEVLAKPSYVEGINIS